MNKTEFEIGDRVKVVQLAPNRVLLMSRNAVMPTFGKIGTVVQLDGTRVSVRFDEPPIPFLDSASFYPEQLEKVIETEIVLLPNCEVEE